jgi:hypothetical protein
VSISLAGWTHLLVPRRFEEEGLSRLGLAGLGAVLLSLWTVVWLVTPAPEFSWLEVTLSLWEVVSFVVDDFAWLFLDIVSMAFCQSFLSSFDALSLASFKAVMLLEVLFFKDFIILSALVALLLSGVVVVGGNCSVVGGNCSVVGGNCSVVGGNCSVVCGNCSVVCGVVLSDDVLTSGGVVFSDAVVIAGGAVTTGGMVVAGGVVTTGGVVVTTGGVVSVAGI